MLIKVAASILSADFRNLAKEMKRVEESGVDAIHIDIMDGHFVPNLTFGPKIVAAINSTTSLFLDVHLMMYNPYDYVEKFIEAGADLITFHHEATEDVFDIIKYIRKCGKLAGLAFNPETSVSMAEKYLGECDLILFMTVKPGAAGQKFIPKVLEKIEFAKKSSKGLEFDIQVDGGINLETAKACKKAGANFLVSGSYLYSFEDLKVGVESLRK